MEGVTVTKHGEQLLVHNPKLKTGLVFGIVSYALFSIGSWWLEYVPHALRRHNANRWVHGSPWSDPKFLLDVLPMAGIQVIGGLFFALAIRYVFLHLHGNGLFDFNRATGTVTADRTLSLPLSRITSVVLHHTASYGSHTSAVYFLLDNAPPKYHPWSLGHIGDFFRYWRCVGNFRKSEHAEAIAQEVGSFLNLPVARI
ncbi:MAG: hypothetical protein JO250_19355 [Armatimonadetes bacterium]|nr:hypothetical protein [Armatimonadota bacterium]